MTTCIRRRHAYWTTCPCGPCDLDRRRKAKMARTLGYRRVSSDAAWLALDRMLANNWTGQAIASACGIPRRSIERLIYDLRHLGYKAKIGPVNSAAIVNHGRAKVGMVGAHGAARRLQGLTRQGWSLEDIAREYGLGPTTTSTIRSGRTERVSVELHDLIEAMTDDIGLRLGGSKRAELHAIRRGWASLFSWDDIDDINAQPIGDMREDGIDEVTMTHLLAGRTVKHTKAERWETIRRWEGSDRQLERLHGWNVARDRRLMREEAGRTVNQYGEAS